MAKKNVDGYIVVGNEWYGAARGRNVYAATNGGPVVIDEGEGAVPPQDMKKKFVPHGCAPGWVRLRLDPCYNVASV